MTDDPVPLQVLAPDPIRAAQGFARMLGIYRLIERADKILPEFVWGVTGDERDNHMQVAFDVKRRLFVSGHAFAIYVEEAQAPSAILRPGQPRLYNCAYVVLWLDRETAVELHNVTEADRNPLYARFEDAMRKAGLFTPPRRPPDTALRRLANAARRWLGL